VTEGAAISLFSGAGGLDLGIEAAGFSTAVAVEWDEDAADTMEKNASAFFPGLQEVLRADLYPLATGSPTGVSTRDILRAGGFSHDLAHHSLHALGSRVIGFSQELFDPGDATGGDASEEMLAAMATQIPHLVAMLGEVAHDDPGSTLGWCDDQTEFEFGIDVVLDGLERRRASTVDP
jgi:hypothetical protein